MNFRLTGSQQHSAPFIGSSGEQVDCLDEQLQLFIGPGLAALSLGGALRLLVGLVVEGGR